MRKYVIWTRTWSTLVEVMACLSDDTKSQPQLMLISHQWGHAPMPLKLSVIMMPTLPPVRKKLVLLQLLVFTGHNYNENIVQIEQNSIFKLNNNCNIGSSELKYWYTICKTFTGLVYCMLRLILCFPYDGNRDHLTKHSAHWWGFLTDWGQYWRLYVSCKVKKIMIIILLCASEISGR